MSDTPLIPSHQARAILNSWARLKVERERQNLVGAHGGLLCLRAARMDLEKALDEAETTATVDPMGYPHRPPDLEPYEEEEDIRRSIWLWIVGVCALLFGLAWIALASPAAAHDWYPRDCCSDRDCFRVPAVLIEITREGYVYVPTGQIFPHDEARVTPPEGGGDFHICTSLGDVRAQAMVSWRDGAACFWAPQGGM